MSPRCEFESVRDRSYGVRSSPVLTGLLRDGEVPITQSYGDVGATGATCLPARSALCKLAGGWRRLNYSKVYASLDAAVESCSRSCNDKGLLCIYFYV